MTFSILIKGFCANYTESSALKNRTIFLLRKDSNNYFKLQFNYSTKKFDFIKCVGGVIVTLSSNAQTFMQFQSYNFLVEQSSVGMIMRLLKNNGTVEKYTNTDVSNFAGGCNLYPLTNDITGNEADAFLGKIQLFKDKNWENDVETDSLLHGTLLGYENGNISTGFILPNNRYTIVGQAKLYCNDYMTRTVQDVDFTTTNRENKVELIGGTTLVRKD